MALHIDLQPVNMLDVLILAIEIEAAARSRHCVLEDPQRRIGDTVHTGMLRLGRIAPQRSRALGNVTDDEALNPDPGEAVFQFDNRFWLRLEGIEASSREIARYLSNVVTNI